MGESKKDFTTILVLTFIIALLLVVFYAIDSLSSGSDSFFGPCEEGAVLVTDDEVEHQCINGYWDGVAATAIPPIPEELEGLNPMLVRISGFVQFCTGPIGVVTSTITSPEIVLRCPEGYDASYGLVYNEIDIDTRPDDVAQIMPRPVTWEFTNDSENWYEAMMTTSLSTAYWCITVNLGELYCPALDWMQR